MKRTGFDADVAVALDGLPKNANVDVQLGPVKKGTTGEMLRLFVKEKAPPATYTINVYTQSKVSYRRNIFQLERAQEAQAKAAQEAAKAVDVAKQTAAARDETKKKADAAKGALDQALAKKAAAEKKVADTDAASKAAVAEKPKAEKAAVENAAQAAKAATASLTAIQKAALRIGCRGRETVGRRIGGFHPGDGAVGTGAQSGHRRQD